MSRTVRIAHAVGLVVAILALGAGVSAAQPRQGQAGGAGITVYDDINFRGATVTFRRDVRDLREFNLNDRISSLQVAPGEAWEVCEHSDYGGRCAVVSGYERDLRASRWTDMISSMRRVQWQGRDGRGNRGGPIFPPDRDEIVLFDRPGYRGAAQNVTGAAAGLGVFTNRAQSAQILNGVWELCDEPRWGGRCVRISSSVPDLRRVGLDGVASARPIDTPRYPPR